MVKVSIVVPIYNVEKYLPQCLDSIVKQTLKDIEIICVDDGSTDSSLEIAKRYQAKDSRFKVITKANAGYGNTMNMGMDAAEGEYIGIVESDDWVEKSMFADLYKTAKRFDAEVVKSDYFEFETVAKKRQVYIQTPTSPIYYNKVINADTLEDIYHFRMNTWTGIYKTSFLRYNKIAHNETPGASYQDNGFWFKTLTLSKRTVFVDKAYYHYRQDNPNSSINSKGKIFCMCDEYAYIREFLNKNPQLLKKHMRIFHVKKYYNYFYTYGRIAREHKIAFLERFAKEYNEAYAKGEFDSSLLPPAVMSILWRIMADYKKFFYDDEIWKLNQKHVELADEKGFCVTEIGGN